MPSTVELAREAGAALAGGDHETNLRLALEGLASAPGDVGLLRVAGRASLELGRDDAVQHLAALTARTPEDAAAWVDLGSAHAVTGDASAAADAFARAVELSPGDDDAVLSLAHAASAAGRSDEALQALERAGERPDAPLPLLRSLVSLARSAGRLPLALSAATRLAAADPKDAGDALDVAELNLEAGRHGQAAAVFARLRHLDEEHATYACHGQIEALIRAGRWRDALDAAIAATALDRHSLTTDLLAFVTARLFGASGREHVAPEWEDLEPRLAAERQTHHRLHAERWA